MSSSEKFIYFWQKSSVLPGTCGLGAVVGPIRSGTGVVLMPSPIAGEGEVGGWGGGGLQPRSRGPGGCGPGASAAPRASCWDGGVAGLGVGGDPRLLCCHLVEDSLRCLSQLPLSPCLCRTARLSTASPALAPRPRTAPSGSPAPSHGPRPPAPRR